MTKHIIPKAFISPLGVLIISYKLALNLLMGFSLAKKEPGSEATIKVSCFLKINNKKGLNKASDTTENKEERILKLK